MQEHYKFFCEVFGMPLKPKHHFLLDYSRFISKMGSLRSNMVYEISNFSQNTKTSSNDVISQKKNFVEVSKKAKTLLCSKLTK